MACVLSNPNCLVQCLNCSNTFTCSRCDYGHYLSEGICHSCPEQCKNCTDLICFECYPGFSLNRHDSCVSFGNRIRVELFVLIFLVLSN